MTPEEAFWILVVMLDRYIGGYFDHGLREIQIAAQVLRGLLYIEVSHCRIVGHMNQNNCFVFVRRVPLPCLEKK